MKQKVRHILNVNHVSSVKQYFDSIANAKGKEKLTAIRSQQNADCIQRRVLEIYLNPLKTFHIGLTTANTMKNIEYNQAETSEHDLFDTLLDLADSRGVTDDYMKNIAQRINGLHNEQLIDFCYQLISQTYKLGVTADTYNKVVGSERIPLMKCMLAKKYYEYPSAVEGKNFAITTKFDGIRCIATINVNNVQLISRQNQRILGAVELENEIKELLSVSDADIMLDGELLVENGLSMKSKEAYKQTVKIVRKDGEKTGICYHIFDMIPKEEYETKVGKMPYAERKAKLDSMFIKAQQTGKNIAHLKAVEWLYYGNNTSVIAPMATEMRKRHQEGVMVNLLNSPYVFGRTDQLLKVKNMQDCDLEIIGFEEGSGKYAGTLGSILVNYKGNVVGVGSGLTDHDRDAFWAYRDQLIGRIITVQYFEETCDAEGKPSMRFPVFVELREEGKEVSYD